MEQAENAKIVKRLAQTLAKQIWDKEAAIKTRTGKMAQIVWSLLLDEKIPPDVKKWVMKALPDKPDGLRRWLTKVAPESAKRKGRPRKK